MSADAPGSSAREGEVPALRPPYSQVSDMLSSSPSKLLAQSTRGLEALGH